MWKEVWYNAVKRNWFITDFTLVQIEKMAL
jgi:hypothetical protein